MDEKEEHEGNMSETDSSQGNTFALRRFRCAQCQFPLLQLYQGDLLYTIRQHGEETSSQQLPAYSYRTLTDPTPLLVCPRCEAILSPATTIAVLPRTIVIEEGNTVQPTNDR
jgi:hypothetical protein